MNFFRPFLDHQERIIKQPLYECYRCGHSFNRNQIRVMWCRDQGELLFIEACHEHANELEKEGWWKE